MARDLPVTTIVDFISGDFKDAWDALAAREGSNLHRGNFLFGRQAMCLLEVACRLCCSDRTGEALKDLSHELAQCDYRYFTEFPGPGNVPPDFDLPSKGANPESELIAVLFDLVRNGQAHQYQQIRLQLTDGKDFLFALTGAEYGLYLTDSCLTPRPPDHLKAWKDAHGDLCMKIRTDMLFKDIDDAVRRARLLSRDLNFEYLSRPRRPTERRDKTGKGRTAYQFSSADLEAQLRVGGHI